MKNFFWKAAAVVALSAVFVLAGCAPTTPPGPTFEERCDLNRGSIMEDSTSREISGTIAGWVMTTKGYVYAYGAPGTGTATITVRQCVVDGAIVDMEVH